MRDYVLHISISDGNAPYLEDLLAGIVDEGVNVRISDTKGEHPFFAELNSFGEET